MSVIVTTQRYNWMGYNGTETTEVDTALLRGEGAPADNYNYEHRQQVIAELKERLYQIKRDLDLLPEEELRAEEENRQRRRADRKRREEEARRRAAQEEAHRVEEEERRRIEQEELAEERRRQEEEDELRRREQEEEAQKNADRWRQLHDNSDDDSDVEEEQNAALSTMPRTQEEIDYAVQGFAKGTRMLLASNGQGYVSYVDGSVHASIDELETYNEALRPAAEAAVAGSSVSVPAAEEYQLDEVRACAAYQQVSRKKLDAYRALQDPTYAARIRSTEKDHDGNPMMEVTAEDGDEAALLARLEAAKEHSETARKAYNERAAASGTAIVALMCSRAQPKAAEAAAAEAPEAPTAEGTAPAAEAEAEADDAAAAAPAAEEAMDAGEADLQEKIPTPADNGSAPADPQFADELSSKRSSKKGSKPSSKKSTPKADPDEL